jgi:hypothetical protein
MIVRGSTVEGANLSNERVNNNTTRISVDFSRERATIPIRIKSSLDIRKLLSEIKMELSIHSTKIKAISKETLESSGKESKKKQSNS